MLSSREIRILASVIFSLCGVLSADAASICADLENKKPGVQLKYLQGERSSLEAKCIVYAIGQLGDAQYAPAIGTLIDYLDYRRPDPPPLGLPGAPLRPTFAGSIYPAVSALFQIGKPAISQLVDVIGDASKSDLARDKAADCVLSIYREHPAEGITLLVEAAHKETDPMDALRLMDQARRESRSCPPQWRNDCENATLK